MANLFSPIWNGIRQRKQNVIAMRLGVDRPEWAPPFLYAFQRSVVALLQIKTLFKLDYRPKAKTRTTVQRSGLNGIRFSSI
jgi:hypothetical protein